MDAQKPTITFDEFCKLDLAVGKIIDIADVPGSEKLYKMSVDFGPAPNSGGVQTIYAGLKKLFLKRQLKGKKFVFVVNLPPRRMPGGESQGMMLVIEHNDGYLLFPAPKRAVEGARLC